jgi:hypothetical protein
MFNLSIYKALSGVFASDPTGPIIKATGEWRRPTRQNHNRGESKARRLMSARSNRINRQNCRGWKH